MPITKLHSVRDFFRIWFFWKRQALFIFLTIVTVIMAYAYTATPQYESAAKIMVLPKTTEGEVISSGYDEKDIKPVTDKDITTEMELITSNSVLEETVTSFGDDGLGMTKKEFSPGRIIKKSIVGLFRFLGLIPPEGSEVSQRMAFLQSCLSIEQITDSNLISVSLRAEAPQQVQKVLDRLLTVYLKHRNAVYTKAEGQQFYEDQAADYKERLDRAETELKEFQKQWDIVNMEVQNASNIKLLSDFNNQLNLLEISYDESRHRIDMLKLYMKDDTDGLYLTREMREIPAIVELEKGIVPLLLKKSEILKSYTEASREYQSILSQIGMLRNEVRNEIYKAIRTDELEIESMGIKIKSLQNRIDKLRQKASDFSQRKKAYHEIMRRVKVYKDSYELYQSKAEDSKILSEKSKRDLANISIAAAPSIPEKPAYPNRLILLVLSLFFGTFSAIVAPFVLESVDNKLKTADDVELLLKLPVISSFAEIGRNKMKNISGPDLSS